MKRFFVFLMIFAVAGFASAADFQINLPDTGWGLETEVTDKLDSFSSKFRTFFDKYGAAEDISRGLDNAAAFAADGGYLRSALDYKFISVSVSTNGSVILDDSDIDQFLDEYHDRGDIYAGVGLQAITGSVGINMGYLLGMDRGLYLTLKAGKSSCEAGDIEFDSTLFGFMVNYQLVKPAGKAGFGWNGINVGAGLTYYSNDLQWNSEGLGSVSYTWTTGSYERKVRMKPDMETNVEISGFVLPVEIITGVKALCIFDIFAGLGADIMFGGESTLKYDGYGTVSYNDGTGAGWAAEKGSVSVSGDVEGDKDNIKFKAVAGLGLALGPVHLELPVTVYFDETPSCSAGLIGGVSF